jgi:hypothetical protein
VGRRDRHAAKLKLRVVRRVARGLWSADHPVLVHMIPIRRCNLTCAYCNEYDRHSPPAYRTRKSCAPYCTISCVHQVSILDRWRDPQTLEFADSGQLVQIGRS